MSMVVFRALLTRCTIYLSRCSLFYFSYYKSHNLIFIPVSLPSFLFALLAVEQAQAQAGAEGGSTQQEAVVGLEAPSAEVQQVVAETGGIPVQAVPESLPERLRTSLAGEEARGGK